jgi:hypothetical protein
MALTIQAFLAALLGSCASIYAGHLIGQRAAKASSGAPSGILNAVLSAHLGLLAFLLAFTFGIAANRLAERKALVVHESNAIGTAGLRASYLPDERATRVLGLLTQYAELRILVPEGKIELPAAMEKNTELTRAIWKETREAVIEGKPNEPATSLFAASINEMFDTGAERRTVVFLHRIPRAFWFALSLIGVLCTGLLGFQGGLDPVKRPGVVVPLVSSLAVVVALIVNMDDPEGLVRLSQEPMKSTLASLLQLQK